MTHYVPNVIVIGDSESGAIEYASRNTEQVLGIEDAFGNAIEEKFLSCISGQRPPGGPGPDKPGPQGRLCQRKPETAFYPA